ncbi:General alpha-glucoside permease [Lachnellula hyalina]|uniref:General alpha-glucoside permease n=1 Tax=Lachnellula hyalina TaxID=1316788 RepID=A0A8H8R2Y7_9HELO|nr:General alpha-glucoside permease [Lachnellula hyalina]TVY27464.1 General alpha-glucoside permease [Lachnellula hyalina]
MSYRYEPVRSSTDGVLRWREDEAPSRSKLYLLCLTISIGGLQVVWATVMAEGSSFLMSLGLQPSVISLTWLAGPICGTLLQPYIGYKSDFCAHRWGRRRPFMIYGTLATIICINLLSWTSEIIRLISYILGASAHGLGNKSVIQVFAITLVWALNIAIQPVQSSIRALIVDACPNSQAAQANSFASFAVIVGSAIGYGCGFIEIPKVAEWFHDPQFKGLALIASVSLGVAVMITSTMIEEKPVENDAADYERSGVLQIWSEIWKSIRTLPSTIKTICIVQFFAWLAWFPFLFNNVLYLGRLYEAQILLEKMGPPSTRFYNALKEQSIRHAVLAMLVFSIVALGVNLCLPYLITNTEPSSPLELEWEKTTGVADAISGSPGVGERRILRGLTLPRAWMISHIITALGLFGATIGNSFMASVSFISLLGISWTLTQWAPFALISAEIASSSDPILSDIEECPSDQSGASKTVDLRPRAGVTMAIHNVAIATPQMLSAVVTALIFWICGQFGVGETDAMRWVLRVGILAACCAAWTARKLW